MSALALEARDVSRRYGRRWALRHVSASFPSGSVTALVGDNGAGKSTLLQLAAGLLRPTEGELRVFALPLAGFPSAAVRARTAVLGHQPGLYPDLTGRENLIFFARLHGRVEVARDPAALAARLARVGLAEAADRPMRTYSRGMIQRLALARVLVQRADLWLLDEPTTGLDARGVALLQALVAEAKAGGTTVVAVTHDLAALGPAVDATLRLTDGRLAAR